MRAAPRQVEIGGLADETEESQAIEAEKRMRFELFSAIRSFVIGYIDMRTGLKGYDACAYHLNRRWESEGRPVTSGALRAALHDSERNNLRAEHLFWFASECPEVAEIMARRVKPAKTDAQQVLDFETEARATFSHKEAEAFIRRARAR
jgi:hypothetical protein